MSRILKIRVESSRFFTDPFEISFSKNLNCIMGGRGTGKTTILSLIAAALTPEFEDNKEKQSLLKANLGDGRIHLVVQNNSGETFEIERVLGERPIVYANDRSIVDFDVFRSSFFIDIYEASLIEGIGRNAADRLALLDKHLTNALKEARSKAIPIQAQLNQNRARIVDVVMKTRDLKKKLEPLAEAERDLREFERTRPPVDDEVKKRFDVENANQSLREFEKKFANTSEQNLSTVELRLKQIANDLRSQHAGSSGYESALNVAEISAIKEIVVTTQDAVRVAVEESLGKISVARTSLQPLSAALTQKHRDQDAVFTELRQRLDKDRELFQKLNQLTQRVTVKAVHSKELADAEEELSTLVDQRKEILLSLKAITRSVFDVRLSKATEINNELQGDVRVTIKEGGIRTEYDKALRAALRGRGFQYNDICDQIVERISPVELSIYVLKRDATSIASICNFSKERAQQIIDGLIESNAIFDVEGVECPDLPTFHLKVDRQDGDSRSEDYRSTENLSTGQRCTAILPIIFAASKSPLLIDQPEDNLDNKYIAESIHKIIKTKKQSRQMIFVTHNPNVPVLGDAEYNAFLDYQKKHSRVLTQGAVTDVKQSILALLEGGSEAFKKRKEMYGY